MLRKHGLKEFTPLALGAMQSKMAALTDLQMLELFDDVVCVFRAEMFTVTELF